MISSAKHLLRSIAFYLPDRLHSLRRKRELKFSRTEISRPQLVADLSRLPIDRDAIVLVHSSLKSLGFVSGGATMVVEALVEAIVKRNGGTVMLPCYSINGTMHQTLLEQRIFDVSKTPSNLERSRKRFASFPKLYVVFTRRILSPPSVPLPNGLPGRITRAGQVSALVPRWRSCARSKVICWDWEPISALSRSIIALRTLRPDFPLAVHTADSPLTVPCRGYSGEAHSLSLNALDGVVARTRIDRPENAAIREFFTERLERHAGLRWFQVGEARSWVILASALYDEARNLMNNGVTIYSTREEIEAFKRVRGEE